MNRRIAALLIAVALSVPTTVAFGPAAQAASGTYYANCTNLTKDYKHGVAKSKKAAKKQVRAGYGMPAHGKRARKVYWRNYKSLDRDKDGTACER